MKSPRLFAALSAAAALALLSGCNLLPEPQPDHARFYVLDARAATESAPADAVRLGLRPVEVPPYLKNKAVALRTGDNEVRFSTEAFWAEPLEAGIARVLRERLAARAAVVSYPFTAQLTRDYDVTVRVLSAEGGQDSLRFSAVVEIVRVGDNAALVARREFTAPAAAWNGDYARLARELSAAVGALADDILASLPKK